MSAVLSVQAPAGARPAPDRLKAELQTAPDLFLPKVSERSVPPGLRITQTMWEDFLWDPVLAAWVILGLKFDAFQQNRLRYYWLVPTVMDSSGLGSGKTIVDWAYSMLRCILIPDQSGAVYFPVFDQGKRTFWKYFKECKSKFFHAQLGRLDETGEEEARKNRVEGSAAWTAYFKNGADFIMPAGSFMKDAITQASQTFSFLLIEEWKHIDAHSQGINKQLIGRVRKRSWNKYHPLWANHLKFVSTAATRTHAGWVRYEKMRKRVAKGDPRVACITYNQKHFSNLTSSTGNTFRFDHRQDDMMEEVRANMSQAEALGEVFGIWGLNAAGWFTEAAVNQCQAMGRRVGLRPVLGRGQFEGAMSEGRGQRAEVRDQKLDGN